MRGPKSDTPDRVRLLAEEGLSPSEIAEALKISRQRVYQVCQSYGIKVLRRSFRRLFPAELRDRGDTACMPRIITGGVQQPTNSVVTATVSELLVAADLVARGWHAYLPVLRQRGHDIIAARHKLVVTVEVRSAYKSRKGSFVWIKEARDCSDHYALVVTGEPVQYQPELPDLAQHTAASS